MTTVPRDKKPTLFMVEDEEGTAVLLKFLLARGGYTVVHAADGQQAHHDQLDASARAGAPRHHAAVPQGSAQNHP